LRKTAFGLPLLKMTKKSYLKTFKGIKMTKQEQKTRNIDVILSALFGAFIGAVLALTYVVRTGGF
jgi:hypothetical protein